MRRDQTTVRPDTTQKVAFTGSAAPATAIAADIELVRLFPTEMCYISLNGDATNSSTPLAANMPEYISVGKGDIISVISAGTDGDLFITNCTQ